jgi:ParB-like chromosome segregation protein Spo0J
LSLNIVYRRIDELKPDPANPRRHTKQQIRNIADSIRSFGFNVPVLPSIASPRRNQYR